MSFFKYQIILVFSMVGFFAFGQKSTIEYYEAIINSSISSEEKLAEVELFLSEGDTIEAETRANIYYEFAKWNWRQHYRIRAKEYALKEFEIRKKLDDQKVVKRNLYNLAYMHSRLSNPDYSQALHFLDTLISITKESEPRLGTLYREKGDIYDAQGDFQRALENYFNAERISKQQNQYGRLLTTYINILVTYAILEDNSYYEVFFQYKEKIDALQSLTEMSISQEARVNLSTGIMHSTTINFMNALEPYQQGLLLAIEDEDDEVIFKFLNNIGVLYNRKGDYSKAEEYFEKSRAYVNNDPELNGNLQDNIGDLFLSKRNFEASLRCYNNAIVGLLNKSPDKDMYWLPKKEDVKISPYKRDILDYLIDKAEGWIRYERDSKNKKFLEEAEKTMAFADEVIDQLYFESREDLSRLFWRQKGGEVYLKAVSLCYKLGLDEKAFYYMEKNKGLMLLEDMTNLKARQVGNVPTAVINREYELLTQIVNLQNSLASPTKISSTTRDDSIRSQIFQYKIRYKKFIDSLEYEYPKYYTFKTNISIVSSKEIQKQLNKGDQIVEYIIGETEGYALLISEKNIELQEIDDVKALKTEIGKFQRFLYSPFESETTKKEFQLLGNKLFAKLFPFAGFKLTNENTRLSIIPDGLLYNIPFEVITSSAEGNLTRSYLINDFEIYYRYSLSVESQMNLIKPSNESSFVGFVPANFKNGYLSSLDGNTTETSAISTKLKGKSFKKKEATKANFLMAYDENSIIHISTHGGVDNGDPWLGFYDEKLKLDELYFLKNQKEMVVLSACKTSVGNHKKGEGVFNLTRGFINSGAKSVVSTLWDVNEKSSAEVIGEFYKELSKGKEKSDALRAAKLNYLAKYENSSEASPYYWSAIILTGDISELQLGFNQWWYLGIGLLFLVLGWLFSRRNQRRS